MSIAIQTGRQSNNYMLCLHCGSQRFQERVSEIEQEFRGETLRVRSNVMVCEECGWETMDSKQADKISMLAADEYRRRRGLLTSREIVAARTRLGLSQRAFARFLEVGEASIKRWEKSLVQDKIYDERIRRKCESSPWLPYPAPGMDDFRVRVSAPEENLDWEGCYTRPKNTDLLEHIDYDATLAVAA